MNISEISGTMVSDPSTATNQIIVDTGDGLQRAIATSAVSGTIVSEDSIETTDCIVDTGSGLQRAIKTAGGGGGGGSSTKYGATINNLLGDVDANGVLQAPSGEATNLVFTGVKGIPISGFRYLFANNNSIGSVSFPDLENLDQSSSMLEAFSSSGSIISASFAKLATISGQSSFENAFASCSNITTVNFPELVTVSGYNSMYNSLYSAGITNISFPKLTTASGMYCMYNLCSGCSHLTTISFPSLTTLSGYGALQHAFYGTKIVQAGFPALSDVTGSQCLAQLFQNCSLLQSISFPALKSTSFGTYTNQFHNMLQNVTGCTVHFPSNLQSVIGSWSDVTAGFGGTNTTVLFDLPATE